MPEPEQQEISFQHRRIKNPKLRRGIFLIPAAFTSANLLCGYYAIVASLVGAPDDFNRAAKAIGLAILFDSLDGRVARMTGVSGQGPVFADERTYNSEAKAAHAVFLMHVEQTMRD